MVDQSRKLIRSLYTRISAEQIPKASQLYSVWKTHWESLHGPVGKKKSARKDVLAKRYDLPEEDLDPTALLYAIDTYYVIRLRLKAYRSLTNDTSLQVSTLLGKVLRAKTFADLGVENYEDAELFNWVSDCADEDVLSGLIQQETTEIHEPRDEVRSLFQSLVPKQFRHSAGAHYTPDWLADYVLQKLNYQGADSQPRLVDPHCGSGTFL